MDALEQAKEYLDNNEFSKAELFLNSVLEEHADNSNVLASLGLAIHKQGRLEEAVQIYNKAQRIAPDCPVTLRNIGIMKLDQGLFDDSVSYLQKSTLSAPDDAKAQNCLSIALLNTHDISGAETTVQKAVGIDPNYAAAWANLIAIQDRLNKTNEAWTTLESAKRNCPDSNLFNLYEAILLRRKKQYQNAIDILENSALPQDPTTILKARNELIRLFDQIGDTEKACQQLASFNEFATQAFGITSESKSTYLEDIKTQKNTFTPPFIQSWPPHNQVPDKKLVFLCGFARSGTTLIQHILGAHPDVYATEEVPAFPKTVDCIKQNFSNYPSCLSALSPQNVKQLQDLYFSIQKQERDYEDKPVLVDKYPLMTPMIGAVNRLFPNAPILFMLRHPCDVVLSCYMHLFAPNNAVIHFYNLEDTVNLYCQLMDLWQHFNQVMTLNVHYVKYEDLVADMEPVLKETLRFIDVPWSDDILHYRTKAIEQGNIKTPSYDQVSQKLYKTSKHRWHNYRELLAPHLDKLKPYADTFGYKM